MLRMSSEKVISRQLRKESSREEKPSPPDGKIQKIILRQQFPLHETAKKADHEEVERLLAYGKCQVNEIDKFGQTALHVAAFEGHLNVVDVLLRKGVNIQLQDKNGWTALHSAAHAAHLHICEKLLLEGCDPNITNTTGSTVLHYLAAMPCSDLLLFVLHLALKKGVNVNVKNEHGATPVHNACLRAGEGNVLFLLMNGADVEISNKFVGFGECAMHMAVRSGKKRVVQLLINYGASLDVPGPDGTPEQSAVKYGFPDIADLLRFCRTSPQEKLAPRKKHHKKMKKKISGKEMWISGSPKRTNSSDSGLERSSETPRRGSGTEESDSDAMDSIRRRNDMPPPGIIHKPAKKTKRTSSVGSPSRPMVPALSAVASLDSVISGSEPSSPTTPTALRSMSMSDIQTSARSSSISKLETIHDDAFENDQSFPNANHSRGQRPSSTSETSESTLGIDVPSLDHTDIRVSPNDAVLSPSKDTSYLPNSDTPPPGTSPRSGYTSPTGTIEEVSAHDVEIFGPMRVPQHSRLLNDKRRQRSVKIDSLMKIFEVIDKDRGAVEVKARLSSSAENSPGRARAQSPKLSLASDLPLRSPPSSGPTSPVSAKPLTPTEHSIPPTSDAEQGSSITVDVVPASPEPSPEPSRKLTANSRSKSNEPVPSRYAIDSANEEALTKAEPDALSRIPSPARRKSFGDESAHKEISSNRINEDASPRSGSASRAPRERRTGSGVSRVDSQQIYGFKSRVTSSPPRSVRTRQMEKTRPKPFSLPLSEVDFEGLFIVASTPEPPPHLAHKDDIVTAENQFYIETGRTTESSQMSARLFIEDTEFTTPHYKDNFFDDGLKVLQHFNFVGHLQMPFYPSGEPVIISCVHKGSHVLGLCRTRAGDTTFNIEWPSDKRVTHKLLIKAMIEGNEDLKNLKIVACKDPVLTDELLNYEKSEKNQFSKISYHKVGVLYIRDAQATEEEILGNRHSSERFEQFLTFLGQKIELQGYTGFDAGLDTKKDRTGEEKIMERKRHIGNDLTAIVFLDGGGTTKFVPPAISGDFLHSFLIIKPLPGDLFQVSVAVKEGVPMFGPPIIKTSVYRKGEAFRDFLLSKIVNAERAALSGTSFTSKRRLARQKLLAAIVDSFTQKSR